MTPFEKYKILNPKSRATQDWTLYGSSGSVRRATCIYCRSIIATCSNNWPATNRFYELIENHSHKCDEKKKYEMLNDETVSRMLEE